MGLTSDARAGGLSSRSVAGRLLRLARTGVRRLTGIARRVRSMVRHKGGARGFVAAAWRIAASEGWRGVGRRTAFLYAPHRGVVARMDPETPADRNDYEEWV